MSSPIQLIVGLANPGEEYVNTRHNAGAWFVDACARDENITLRHESKFHGFYGKVDIDGKSTHLLIPTTFMNLSGQAVAALMRYLKINEQSVLIAHDDIDLPVGTVRLKYDGGDGGHNGLRDIISHLGTKKFYRLRIGVGRPPHKDAVDYVLTKPSKTHRLMIDAAIQSACDVLPLLVNGHPQKAMQQLHTINEDENGS